MALKPINVSQLNEYINRVISTDPLLSKVYVIGQISNLKFHSSGHVYFSIKDESSKVNCFLNRDRLESHRFQLDEGMEVTIFGSVSVYTHGGYYSLYVQNIEVQGQGNLDISFEKLKKKLDMEGIFDSRYKLTIPEFPHKVAVVTAKTGAAIQDIVKTIQNKNNYVDVIIYPVSVQGKTAAEEISSAIDDINSRFAYVDTIILGRGGGSIEDLWAFNEEVVARSIFNSKIPIVSGIGHEIDFTIADMVVDKRGETPTAAANLAVPDIDLMKSNLRDQVDLMKMRLYNIIEKRENTLKLHGNQLDNLNPKNLFKRGYCGLTREDGRVVDSISTVNLGERLEIFMTGGKIVVKVDEIVEE